MRPRVPGEGVRFGIVLLMGCLCLLFFWRVLAAKAPATPARDKKTQAKSRWRAMLPLLSHKDVKKRKEALQTWRAMVPQPPLPWAVLQKALADKDWSVRVSALRFMGHQPKTSQDKVWQQALRVHAKDKHWRVRAAALDVMKRLANPPKAVALDATQDAIWEVRERGIDLLGRALPVGPKAIAALSRAFADPKWQVRAAAFHAMRGVTRWSTTHIAAAAKALEDPEPTVQLLARDALVAAGKRAGDVLLAATRSPKPRVRQMAAEALARLPGHQTASLARLAVMLSDPIVSVREAVGAALGRLGPHAKPALPQLVQRLTDKSPAVQSIAVWALGRMGALAVPALARALRHTKHDHKTNAAKALSAMGPTAAPAAPFLIDALLDPRWEVRLEATWALYRMGAAVGKYIPSSMLPILLNALRDKAWKIRFGLVHTIGHIGPKARIVIGWFGPKAVSTLGLLRKLRRDPHPHVRRAAKSVLRKLSKP